MGSFAQTYPQLMNQARDVGLDPAEQVALRRAYELAEELSDGLYRQQATPFVCHLVRTASIVLSARAPSPVACAALVHAAYRVDRFDGSRRRRAGRRRRAQLRRALGSEAEALVWEYQQLPWYTADAVQGHLERLEGYSARVRQALLVRCADELDDCLDAGLAYAGEACMAMRLAAGGDGCVELARRLGHAELASELSRAYQACRRLRLPEELTSGRASSYERPRAHRWERTAPERLLLGMLRAGRRAWRRTGAPAPADAATRPGASDGDAS